MKTCFFEMNHLVALMATSVLAKNLFVEIGHVSTCNLVIYARLAAMFAVQLKKNCLI